MADDLRYGSNKRKFDDDADQAPPPPRRPTGFSAPVVSAPPVDNSSGPAPPADGIELAKQRAQEIAARLLISAEANRSKADNGEDSAIASDHSLKPLGQPMMSHVGTGPPLSLQTYGYQGPSKRIEIPNGRVGVIIGKGGETIRNLQLQSGAKIQVTRDMDADPNSQTRTVELVGNSEQINRAELLISDVLAEAEAGGSSIAAAHGVVNVPAGADRFVMRVPNNRVGLVIGKGGETIRSMQAKTGARVQVIPLHLPPGDTSLERTVQIDGTPEQIEAAKQLVNEVTSGQNRTRNPSYSGGYSQPGYNQPPPQTWASPGAPQMQQPGYGYMQPGAYLSQPYGGYASYPDQSSNQQTQQPAAATGYDYYGQQQAPSPQQPVGGSAAPADNNSYNQPPPSYGSQGSYGQPAYSQPGGQQQGYGQDSYSSGYQVQPGYAQQGSTTQPGYNYPQSYSSAPNYPPQDGSAPAYGNAAPPTQQAPPPVQAATAQSGYNVQPPSSAAGGYPSQPGYESQAPASGYMQSPTLAPTNYGQLPQGQRAPPTLPSPTTQPGHAQQGYAQPPPAQSGYSQAPPPSGYGGPQPGYGQQQQQAYGGIPPQNQTAYGSTYPQPPAAYPTDGVASVPASGAKASPQS